MTPAILYGVKRIASHLGLKPHQARYLIEQERIPTFRMGTVVCTTPALLEDYFREMGG